MPSESEQNEVERALWSPEYVAQSLGDFRTALYRNMTADYPNYGDLSVTLPAGHWRAILSRVPFNGDGEAEDAETLCALDDWLDTQGAPTTDGEGEECCGPLNELGRASALFDQLEAQLSKQKEELDRERAMRITAANERGDYAAQLNRTESELSKARERIAGLEEAAKTLQTLRGFHRTSPTQDAAYAVQRASDFLDRALLNEKA